MSGYEVDYENAPETDPDKIREAAAEKASVISDITSGVPFWSSLPALYADWSQYKDGDKEAAAGDTTEGGLDRIAGFTGGISDGISLVDGILDAKELMTGSGGPDILGDVAAVAGSIQGLAEMGKGGFEIYKGATTGDDFKIVDGVTDAIGGMKDFASSSGDPRIGLAGKVFGLGMDAGEWLAPKLMGDLKESVDVRQSDGEYVPSTGWGVSDWVFGAGKYTDSRWAPDGQTDAEIRQAEKDAEVDKLIADNPDMSTWDLMKKMASGEE